MKLVSIVLIVVGVIHLVPLKGVLGADSITALYGVDVSGRDLELLLRHRALLFGLLGAFLIVSAFYPAQQPAAIIAGITSTLSFIVLSWLIGKPNDLLNRVVWVDWIATVLLLIAGVVLLHQKLMR
jgi:predicted tellurium resistance membrane protein TerC